MTGGTATFGISTDEGLRLALDDINAKGGVLGKQIKVVVEDDQSRPEEAVTAVQKLVNQKLKAKEFSADIHWSKFWVGAEWELSGWRAIKNWSAMSLLNFCPTPSCTIKLKNVFIGPRTFWQIGDQ